MGTAIEAEDHGSPQLRSWKERAKQRQAKAIATKEATQERHQE